MQRIRLGPTDLDVSVIGLGCSRLGSFLGGADPREAARCLAAALDVGINLFDTADIYGQGDSERFIGRMLRGHRERAIVCTKVGKRFSRRALLAARIKPLVRAVIDAAPGLRGAVARRRNMELQEDFAPAHLARAVDGCLKRLGTDYVDLLLLHSPPESVTRDPEVFDALSGLQRQGKLRHYGVSCDSAAAAAGALGHAGVSVLQIPVNRIEPDMAQAVLPAARARGVGMLAREVLAGGKLATTLGPAVRFALDMPGVHAAIVGTTRAAHLRELVAAYEAPSAAAASLAMGGRQLPR